MLGKNIDKACRFVCTVLFCSMILSLAGCVKPDIEDKFTRVAGNIEETDETGYVSYQIAIKDDGTIAVQGNPPETFVFNEWEDIVSVSAGDSNAGGIKSDGTVVVTGYIGDSGVMEVDDWRDIVMLEFTWFVAYGLKNNGTVVHTGQEYRDEIWELETKIMDAVDKWRNIVHISVSSMTVAGVNRNGRVLVATDVDVEFIERTADWRNIKQVSVSDFMIVGLTYYGEVLVAYDGWIEGDEFHVQKIQDEWVVSSWPVSLTIDHLEGAIKICAGDSFVAGLMADGTLKTCDTGGTLLMTEDLLALNGEKDVVDINSHADTLVVLKKDGTILVAGQDD